jgi:hypothetical protein
MMRIRQLLCVTVAGLAAGAILPRSAAAQGGTPPAWLRDRGPGVVTSIFGTYVRRGELLVYPFFEYSRDRDREYQPAEFDMGPNIDFLGRYRSTQKQLFIGYGLSDRLAIMVEAAVIEATFDKSPDDTYTTFDRIEESGLADLEGEIRWRIREENEHRPEIFGYLEVTAPSQKDKLIIGDPVWDFRPGLGLIRGYDWGTLLVRTDLEYNREASIIDIGELAIEYLRRLSPAWRLYLAVEGGEGGAPDEWDLVTGLQWWITDRLSLQFNNALGITAKATDWAPQVGLAFSFPLRPE